jgi:hypothetical protein
MLTGNTWDRPMCPHVRAPLSLSLCLPLLPPTLSALSTTTRTELGRRRHKLRSGDHARLLRETVRALLHDPWLLCRILDCWLLLLAPVCRSAPPVLKTRVKLTASLFVLFSTVLPTVPSQWRFPPSLPRLACQLRTLDLSILTGFSGLEGQWRGVPLFGLCRRRFGFCGLDH